MNKIVNINLGGYPISIDTNAYEHLNDYLDMIHRHFKKSDGYEEITTDIECRMAELFEEQLGSRKIVNLQDVKDVIIIMGTPEDFGADSFYDHIDDERHDIGINPGKRLFRDPKDKIIGGVCSGLSAFLGIDNPAWIRIISAVLLMTGGIGVLPYIVLWIVIPEATSASDRLAMRGEPINVSNIAKTIEHEIGYFSDKVTEWGEEISAKMKK